MKRALLCCISLLIAATSGANLTKGGNTGETLTDTRKGVYEQTGELVGYNSNRVRLTDTKIYLECRGKRGKSRNVNVRVTYDGFEAKCRFIESITKKNPGPLQFIADYRPERPHDESAYAGGHYQHLTRTYSEGLVKFVDRNTDVAVLEIIKNEQIVESVKVVGLPTGRFTDIAIVNGRATSYNVLPVQANCNASTINELREMHEGWDISHCI